MGDDRVIIQSLEELLGLLEDRMQQAEDVLVLGVCGLGGAGKTTLCRQIIARCRHPAVHLDCDRFSRHSFRQRRMLIAEALASGLPERVAMEENPCNWYAFDAIGAALRDLRSSRQHTCTRAWNKRTGELDDEYHIVLPPDVPSVILCDCIYLLHDPMPAALDVALLVDTPLAMITERGRARSKGDDARAADMERLMRTYAIPYFSKYARTADWVLRDRGSSFG